MDAVFKALADETRRRLLDALFERDGQTLGELCETVEMSRFGVMKHLRVLEAADVIVTKRSGREKLHYLNPVPIQQIYNRWVDKYAGRVSRRLTRLKEELEQDDSARDARSPNLHPHDAGAPVARDHRRR